MRIHHFARSLVLLAALSATRSATAAAQNAALYRPATDRLIDAATKDSAAWNRIAELTDTFGNRLSGSDALERAIDWTLAKMGSDGLPPTRRRFPRFSSAVMWCGRKNA